MLSAVKFFNFHLFNVSFIHPPIRFPSIQSRLVAGIPLKYALIASIFLVHSHGYSVDTCIGISI